MCCTTCPHRSAHLQRHQVWLLSCVVGAVGTPHGPTNQASVHHQLLGGTKNLACTERMHSWNRSACSIEAWVVHLASCAPLRSQAACWQSMHARLSRLLYARQACAARHLIFSATIQCCALGHSAGCIASTSPAAHSTQQRARLGTHLQCSSAVTPPSDTPQLDLSIEGLPNIRRPLSVLQRCSEGPYWRVPGSCLPRWQAPCSAASCRGQSCWNVAPAYL